MTNLKLPATTSSRQMDLLFDTKRSEGLAPLERDKVVSTLAQISDAGGRSQRRGA